MVTLISMPTSVKESRRFCAWAGACDPHPMTPIFSIPSKALGRRGKRSLPPFTMVSLVSANVTSSVLKIVDSKLCLRQFHFKMSSVISKSIFEEEKQRNKETNVSYWRKRGDSVLQ
mmetsp:Transcript_1804/g.2898  ORF Transcript_1804/g.2898 Transcript_1804/m.2898 type:complete len:116 (+) Transcript_1804:634-981(+)